MMGAKSHADESSGPAEPSLPHQQAVDMTAPETFTTAPRQPLTKGRRPDRTAICAFRSCTASRSPAVLTLARLAAAGQPQDHVAIGLTRPAQ